MPTFVRKSDGAIVSREEAIDSADRLRAGYKFGMMQPGERIGCDIALIDTRPDIVEHREAARVPPLFGDGAVLTGFTDAERAYASSSEGVREIARARHIFEMRQAHRPLHDRLPWSDMLAASHIRAMCAPKQRLGGEAVQQTPNQLAQTIRDAQQLRDTALRNRWQGR